MNIFLLSSLLVCSTLALSIEKSDRRDRKFIGYLNGHGHHSKIHPQTHDNSIVDTKALEVLDDLNDNGTPDENGLVCVQKVMMIQETKYDEVMTCVHKYQQRCHDTFTTVYEPHQEQECDEKYKKICTIAYDDIATNEEVEVCRASFYKDCDEKGEKECNTVYETECTTVQKVHDVEDDVVNCVEEYETKCQDETLGLKTEQKCDKWPVKKCSVTKTPVRKYTPETKCEKIPRLMCSEGCAVKEGPVECQKKVKAVVHKNPVEECDIEPVKECRHVTQLVPSLKSVQECLDVPSEVCAMSKVNPTRVDRPTIQKWCYKPEATTDVVTSEAATTSTEAATTEASTEASSEEPITDCSSNSDCATGFCDLETRKCFYPEGNVLLKRVVISTNECPTCTDSIMNVTLYGKSTRINPNGYTCDFKADPLSYYNDGKLNFLGSEALGSCNLAPLGGELKDDGKIIMENPGNWNLQTMCVEWHSLDYFMWKCSLSTSPNLVEQEYVLQCSEIEEIKYDNCDDVLADEDDSQILSAAGK